MVEAQLRRRGIHDEGVLRAMLEIPREEFVPAESRVMAYQDEPIHIGRGQTISQPFVVALMTQLLRLACDDKILEIGTGSGFQTAILAQFSRRVYTVERNRDLGEATRKRLRDMGYENIVFKIGDGSHGWSQHAPFDRIIVTAGAPVLPPSLSEQLAESGIMIIPAGDRSYQDLEVYEKTPAGLKKTSAGGVVFVPLVGDEGWEK